MAEQRPTREQEITELTRILCLKLDILECELKAGGRIENKYGLAPVLAEALIDEGYVLLGKFGHIIKKPETPKEMPPEVERYRLMSAPEHEPETLTGFKKCLAGWLEANRLRIWVGVKMEHGLTQYLADYGIMIPTSAGLMKPRGLLKCP